MNFESIKSGNESSVREFEKQLGFDLPKDYKNFLIQNDGVKFVNYSHFYVSVLEQNVLIDILYGVTGEKRYSITRKNNIFKDEIPQKSLLIGEDPGGTPVQLPPRFAGLKMMQILKLITGKDYSLCPCCHTGHMIRYKPPSCNSRQHSGQSETNRKESTTRQ